MLSLLHGLVVIKFFTRPLDPSNPMRITNSFRDDPIIYVISETLEHDDVRPIL
jgi:hypothetical protein